MTRESNRAIKPAERPASTGTARANQHARRKMTEAEVICGRTAEQLAAEQAELRKKFYERSRKAA